MIEPDHPPSLPVAQSAATVFGPDLTAAPGSHAGFLVLAFFLSVPSGASLLLHIYNVAEMSFVVPVAVLPSCIGLAVLGWYAWGRKNTTVCHTLAIGFASGLVGTLAYDVYRIPYQFLGYRIFVPIRVYGIWILDSPASSLVSDVTGWLYHFSNGITFAIAFAICARMRHWMWGIVWGLTLETIAVLTPFAALFGMSGRLGPLLIAYSGHVAYGLPLGLMAQRGIAPRMHVLRSRSLRVVALAVLTLATVIYCALLLDVRRGEFHDRMVVENTSIAPDIVRLRQGEPLTISNSAPDARTLILDGRLEPLRIPSRESIVFTPTEVTIIRVYQRDILPTRSSFIVVDNSQ